MPRKSARPSAHATDECEAANGNAEWRSFRIPIPLLCSPFVLWVVVVCLLGCDGAERWSFEADASVDSPSTEVPEVATFAPPTCTSNADCSSLPGLFCDLSSGLCVACVDDSQCASSGRPRCDPLLHQCVQCETSGDCLNFETCISHLCIPTCGDSGTCPPSVPYCDEFRGVCVQCFSDPDCNVFGGDRVCDKQSGTCVDCLSDDQCHAPVPRCNRTNQCVECLTSSDCRYQQMCSPSTYTCLGRPYGDN
jgi:hypothetical protein